MTDEEHNLGMVPRVDPELEKLLAEEEEFARREEKDSKSIVEILTDGALADRLMRATQGNLMVSSGAVFNGFTFGEVKGFMAEAARRLDRAQEEERKLVEVRQAGLAAQQKLNEIRKIVDMMMGGGSEDEDNE